MITHKEFLRNVGMEMKVARIRKGISIKEVSETTGLSISSIWNIENGKRDAQILSYFRIATALQTEIKNFL